MAYFDFLIDKGDVEPKKGMEYVFRDPSKSYSWFKNGVAMIVTDVVKLPSGWFEFKVKDTGETDRTTYGWALGEYTPENIELMKQCDKHWAEVEESQNNVSRLLDVIKSLKQK